MKKREPKPETRRPLSRGIGESKKFIAAGERDAFEHLRGLHLGGQPIEEVLRPDQAALVTYDHTDEGIAERNRGKADSAARVRKTGGDRAPVIGEDRDQKLAQRRDFKHEGGLEPWEAPDPMKELVEQYVAPGMRARFLSPLKIQKQGARGFEIVRNEKGEPVKLGELILGEMPAEKAEQRNRVYREKDHQRLREVDQRNQKHARLDRAEALRPIVREFAEPQGDERLHSDWADNQT